MTITNTVKSKYVYQYKFARSFDFIEFKNILVLINLCVLFAYTYETHS